MIYIAALKILILIFLETVHDDVIFRILEYFYYTFLNLWRSQPCKYSFSDFQKQIANIRFFWILATALCITTSKHWRDNFIFWSVFLLYSTRVIKIAASQIFILIFLETHRDCLFFRIPMYFYYTSLNLWRSRVANIHTQIFWNRSRIYDYLYTRYSSIFYNIKPMFTFWYFWVRANSLRLRFSFNNTELLENMSSKHKPLSMLLF